MVKKYKLVCPNCNSESIKLNKHTLGCLCCGTAVMWKNLKVFMVEINET